jgi:hypothetical protein
MTGVNRAIGWTGQRSQINKSLYPMKVVAIMAWKEPIRLLCAELGLTAKVARPVSPLVVILLALSSRVDAVTVRLHGELPSCVFTIGDFCPVESIGLSLLGTFVLSVAALMIWRAFSALQRIVEKERPPSPRKVEFYRKLKREDDMSHLLKRTSDKWKAINHENIVGSRTILKCELKRFSDSVRTSIRNDYPDLGKLPERVFWELI